MEFRILDSNFQDQILLDRYESLLWVDRYNEPGDFELYTPPTDELLKYCQVGNYLYSKESEHLMIIENVALTTDYEQGKRIIIKGRSIESILDRRILWYKTQFRNNLEDGIRQILDYSMITAPDDSDRRINNFIFEYSGESAINNYSIDLEFDIGTDLLTVIQTICKTVQLGFKITLNNNNQFVFKLYVGVNHSYSQVKNPWVVFSKRFENLITNEFVNDYKGFKNVVRTVGASIDGEDPKDFLTTRKTASENLVIMDQPTEEAWEHEHTWLHFNCEMLTFGEQYNIRFNYEPGTYGIANSLVVDFSDEYYNATFNSLSVAVNDQKGYADLTFTLNPYGSYNCEKVGFMVEGGRNYPYIEDYNKGYVSGGIWHYESSSTCYSNIYKVKANSSFDITIEGYTAGNVLNVMFTTTDITKYYSNVSGQYLIDISDPYPGQSTYDVHGDYFYFEEAGYLIVTKDMEGTTGIELSVKTGNDACVFITNVILSQLVNKQITGLDRREVYNDASSIDKTEEMSDSDYMNQLQQSANKVLDENIPKTTVNGTVEDKVSYEYGKDYYIGDIVQVENEFGILGTMRVSEFITSHSTSGIEMYPKFTSTAGGDES